MRMLRDITDIEEFMKAVDRCSKDVMLYGTGDNYRCEFNLKSALSKYIAIGRLCEEQGDSYEVFCSPEDEQYLMKFFADKQERDKNR